MSKTCINESSNHRAQRVFAAVVTALLAATANAQSAQTVALEDALASLVGEALERNVELAGGAATVSQRLAELDVARARFRPVLDLSARYSRAEGGRTFEIAAADLVNPVYETLEGWCAPTSGARTLADLPDAARTYLDRIEALAGAPVRYVSVGTRRDQIIEV